MADEVSTGELARRLDAITSRFDEITRLLQGLVSRAEYSADQRAAERRFMELEQDIAEKRRVHDQDIRDLREEIKALRTKVDDADKSNGVNLRQAVYSGLVPGILLVVSLLVTVLLAFKGGR